MTAPCIISAGTVIEDFTNIASWSVGANVYPLMVHRRCLDDANKKGAIFRLSQTASPSWGSMWRTDKSINMSAMNTLTLDFQNFANIDNINQLPKLKIELSSSTSFTTTFVSNEITLSSYNSVGGLRWTLRKADFTTSNGESWNNTMVAIRISTVPGITSYGNSGYAMIYLDKLVMDRTCTPLVLLSGLTSASDSSRTYWLSYMNEYGWYGGKVRSSIDYDNVGDTDYITWSQIQEQNAQGLYAYPTLTGWLMRGDTTPQQEKRPVPPYPSYDAAYDDMYDITNANGYQISDSIMKEIMHREKVIHAYYGIPWRTPMLSTHGGQFTSTDARRWIDSAGFSMFHDEAVWTDTNKTIQLASLPVGRSVHTVTCWGTSITHQRVMDAIDEAVDAGRYLGLTYGILVESNPGNSDWLRSNCELELDHIKEHELAGDLEVVSLETFVTRAQQLISWYPENGGGDVVLGSINLNDQINYFVDNEGFNVGQKQTTWEETVTYGNNPNAQTNINTKALIPVTIPMRVAGTTLADLETHLEDLWVEVDKGSNTLQVGADESYTIVTSTRPDTIDRDEFYQLRFNARFILVLMRQP